MEEEKEIKRTSRLKKTLFDPHLRPPVTEEDLNAPLDIFVLDYECRDGQIEGVESYDPHMMRCEAIYNDKTKESIFRSSSNDKDDDNDNDDDVGFFEDDDDDLNTLYKRTDPKLKSNIIITGLTEKGQSVYCEMPFRPFCFVEVPDKWGNRQATAMKTYLEEKMDLTMGDIQVTICPMSRFMGWVPDIKNPMEVRKFNMFEFSFPSMAHMRDAHYKLHKKMIKKSTFDITDGSNASHRFYVYEAIKVSGGIKFLDKKKMTASGWIRVDPKGWRAPKKFKSHAQIEVETKHTYVDPIPEKDTIPPLVTESFDFEAFEPQKKEKFPDASEEYCPISAIGATYARFGDGPEKYQRYVFALKRVPKLRGGRDWMDRVNKFAQDSDEARAVVLHIKNYLKFFPSTTITSILNRLEDNKITAEKLLQAHHDILIGSASTDDGNGNGNNNIHHLLVHILENWHLDGGMSDGIDHDPTPEAIAEGNVPITFIEFDSEEEMILAWRDFRVLVKDVDFITGYNIKNFDLPYVDKRLNLFADKYFQIEGYRDDKRTVERKQSRFFFQSRLIYDRSHIKEKNVDNQGMGGKVTMNNMFMTGRVLFDMYYNVKEDRSLALPNFKLGTVGKKVLGRGKIHLDPEDMNELFRGGTGYDRYLIINPRMTRRFIELHREIATSSLLPLLDDESDFERKRELENKMREIDEAIPDPQGEDLFTEEEQDELKASEEPIEDVKKTPMGAYRAKIVLGLRRYAELLEPHRDSETYQNMIAKIARIQRRRLSEYCSRDCDIPLEVMAKRLVIENAVEMSRISNTSLMEIESRGQQIKIFNTLHVQCHKRGYVVNRPDSGKEEEKYEGATVLEPIVGYYSDFPVMTEDFKSLYPSIIRDNLLCPSNWLMDIDDASRQEHEYYPRDYYKNMLKKHNIPHKIWHTHTKSGREEEHIFVQHLPGIICDVLTSLGVLRTSVKGLMKKVAKGSAEYNLLDARQLSVKVFMNSVYGFFGVKGKKALLACLPVSKVTTLVGREMIKRTMEMVEKDFVVDFPEYAYINFQVIYGDTDSVMVNPIGLRRKTEDGESEVDFLKRVFVIGDKIGRYCTEKFGGVIELEFEKVYYPYLLMKKKNYIGRKFEYPEEKPELDIKGISVIKRDTPEYVRKTCKEMIGPLMHDRDPQKATERLIANLERLANDEVPFDEFIKNVKLGGSEDCSAPQYEVNKIMAERDPGSEYAVGDRVPFVITYKKGLKRGAKLGGHAEEANYARKKRVKLDRSYMIHALQPIAAKIMQFFPINVKGIMDEYDRRIRAKDQNLVSIDTFFKSVGGSGGAGDDNNAPPSSGDSIEQLLQNRKREREDEDEKKEKKTIKKKKTSYNLNIMDPTQRAPVQCSAVEHLRTIRRTEKNRKKGAQKKKKAVKMADMSSFFG